MVNYDSHLHIMCPQNESIIFHISFNINESGCGRVVGCHGIVANYIMGIQRVLSVLAMKINWKYVSSQVSF